jgi:SAM-dependent methyltransferase
VISIALDAVALPELLEELTATLERAGANVEMWVRDADHAVLAWRPASWEPDETAELELRAEGSHVVIELRGLEGVLGEQRVGWLADLIACATPARLGDWLTDRYARRPSGAHARETYRDPGFHRPSFGAVLAALELGPEDVLLEIGCGGGAFLEQALTSGCRAAGIDHSPEMVHVARELNADAIAAGRLEVVQGDAASLPFADESFTCAAMMQVFFFLPDAAAVLAECARVLKPEGRLAVFTVAEEARGTPASPEPMASRSYFYDDEELAALALRAGFGDALVTRPDLEPFARAARLPDDVIPFFSGVGFGQLLLATR